MDMDDVGALLGDAGAPGSKRKKSEVIPTGVLDEVVQALRNITAPLPADGIITVADCVYTRVFSQSAPLVSIDAPSDSKIYSPEATLRAITSVSL
jgi:enamine deaminase RidA (YjgF/YER057c/UK114 family)